MDNQHKKIAGYRDLSQTEIDLMNEAKALAEQCREFALKLQALEVEKAAAIDRRWLAIGETHLQQGFMAVVRSIAKPTTY